ncbi:frizzled-2-like [Convolutriloba macropyga]|uniref:frizzled-2-like n=1 Tax=Convolutriloba macropyga TaxID=536237 RepID=UPI003F51BDDD
MSVRKVSTIYAYNILVIIFITKIHIVSTNTSCKPIDQIFENDEVRDLCTRYTPWYTDALTISDQKSVSVHGIFKEGSKCPEIAAILACTVFHSYCRPINATPTVLGQSKFSSLNPCKSFCRYVTEDCEMDSLNFACENYDHDAEPITKQEFESGSFLDDIFTPNGNIKPEKAQAKAVCIPHYEYAIEKERMENSKCPSKLLTNSESYSFMGVKKCGAPCNRLLFSETDRMFLRKWTFSWSVLCFISCLFTFVTYLLDRHRFNYPEVSIIYFSFCYIFISLSYITGFFAGDSFSCNSLDMETSSTLEGYSDSPVITQSLEHFSCTISFVILYYFTMASALWWVVLCFTWYLTAGLKWSHEAIASKAFLFHAVVWLIPLGLTLGVVGLNGVEGDDLTGTCLTGTLSTELMLYCVFGPLTLFLVTGFAFIVFGLISMCRIRSVVKVTFDSKSADSFQKLILRIGLFSLFYMVPMAIVVACYYYEIASRPDWFETWRQVANPESAQQSPTTGDNGATQGTLEHVNKTPEFKIFVLKYFLNIVVGVASLFWVLSNKTVNLWLSVFCACTEVGRNSKRKTLAQEAPIKQLGITANPDIALHMKNLSNKDLSPGSNEGNNSALISKSGSPHSSNQHYNQHQGHLNNGMPKQHNANYPSKLVVSGHSHMNKNQTEQCYV